MVLCESTRYIEMFETFRLIDISQCISPYAPVTAWNHSMVTKGLDPRRRSWPIPDLCDTEGKNNTRKTSWLCRLSLMFILSDLIQSSPTHDLLDLE